MNEVYIVTRGSYSDYSIHGVFFDKEVAFEHAKQITTEFDIGRVETHKIKTNADLLAPVGHRAYSIIMDIDGNNNGVSDDSIVENDVIEFQSYIEIESKGSTYEKTGRYRFYIITDKGGEGAIKIANERRIRMIADNKWPIAGEVVEYDYIRTVI